jgi:hypothetical protein
VDRMSGTLRPITPLCGTLSDRTFNDIEAVTWSAKNLAGLVLAPLQPPALGQDDGPARERYAVISRENRTPAPTII